jgi:L-asparaginase
MRTKARVALIPAGGTIDTVGTSRLDIAWYTENRRLLRPRDIASIHETDFGRFPSFGIVPEHWLQLTRAVQELLHSDDCDGVVITHGTNTVEETAYFLDLTLSSPKPVVLVGAMRPSSALGADGPLNLVRAVQVAASEEARGHGVLVVVNDTIHSARDVVKTATFRAQAFQAPDLGPLGYADADGRVVFYHRHVRGGAPFDMDGLTTLPRVDVVVSYVGADGIFIDAAIAAGARGIVSAGAGAGRPTSGESEAFDRALAHGIVVCQSSRVGSGRIARSPAFVRRGLVAADNLQPWKAKVLLSLALTQTTSPAEIQEQFDCR